MLHNQQLHLFQQQQISVTVILVAVLLSSEVETSLIDNDGVASSSVMVNVPVASLIVALDALDKVIVTVSFASSKESAKNCYTYSPRCITSTNC